MFFLQTYQWEILIGLEVISWICLLAFGLLRYLFDQRRLSNFLILIFISLIIVEAIIGLFLYKVTGEFSTFQLIVVVFVLYAITFGVSDFKKFDRWMRLKIGKWRGVELLIDQEKDFMQKEKDPKYIAKKYRRSSTIHLSIFLSVQVVFWLYGTSDFNEMVGFLKDLSWIEDGNASNSPYANETIYSISMVWGIIFIVDFIYSWSYTIFPSNSKG